ncbi:hypothetical protein HAX54_019240 [Datura stramonium]|uniref:Uncharacterized protein n=1 Tax=Datura stramonium TaxID=4076 RepID=A0ABS8UQD6_DATST|nr:hypothetical protein [Datura stramonium]
MLDPFCDTLISHRSGFQNLKWVIAIAATSANRRSSLIDLPNIAYWHHSAMYRRFVDPDRHFVGKGNSSSSTRVAQIHYHSYHRFRIVRADGVIILDTKTDKDAPSMKRAKCTMSKTPPPHSASSTTSTTQFHLAVAPTPTPPDLLKIAQRAQVHESQLVKLAKAIPSMIQIAIKKAMQPAKDKLKSLCSTVEVLKSKVISLRQEDPSP